MCVTHFDVKRISEATGMKSGQFLDLVPEPPERERKEPAIIINGGRCLLVLKRQKDDVCFFYSGNGCRIYEARPMLCRSYPYRVSSFQSRVLNEMRSRACVGCWNPQGKDRAQYLADCKEYEKEVNEYRKIAEKWNAGGGGSLSGFLEFLESKITIHNAL